MLHLYILINKMINFLPLFSLFLSFSLLSTLYSLFCLVVVEYRIGDLGYIRYYLAPKIDEEEENS